MTTTMTLTDNIKPVINTSKDPVARKKYLVWVGYALLIPLALIYLYNLYTSFFPVSYNLEHDAAEYLHVAYLMSIGQKPFIDFMENHPLLFPHFLRFIYDLFHPNTISEWTFIGRIVVAGHFLICVMVIYKWSSRIVIKRPIGMRWLLLFIISWAMTNPHNDLLYYVWQMRPDFICYAYTALGMYLIFLATRDYHKRLTTLPCFELVTGGMLIAIGNAIIPKGILLIVPTTLTVLFNCMDNGQDRKKLFSLTTITRLSIAGAVCMITYLLLLTIDLRLSDSPLSTWISGVITLNTRKHIILSIGENNPIASLIQFLDLPYLATIMMLFWIMRAITSKTHDGNRTLLVFSLFVIATNLIVAPFSNGVALSYYLIPSFFAVALIYLTILTKAYCFITTSSNNSLTARTLFLFIAGILLIQLSTQAATAILTHRTRQDTFREFSILKQNDFTTDSFFPADLLYLTRTPNSIPVRSQHWGYYFMLADNNNFWNDMYSNGLGPSPQKMFGQHFFKSPPDALAFKNWDEINEFLFLIKKCQHINVALLSHKIQRDYVLIQKKFASFFIRQDLLAQMFQRGWRIVDISRPAGQTTAASQTNIHLSGIKP